MAEQLRIIDNIKIIEERNDGTKITYALFHFGKKQEKIIYEHFSKEFYNHKNKK